MGHLHHHHEPAVAQTLHHPGVPQRPLAVQELRVQLSDEVGQLCHGAGLREPHTVQVVVNVERGVLNPCGLAKSERFGK